MESDSLAEFLTRLILPTVPLRLCDWLLVLQHVNNISKPEVSCSRLLLTDDASLTVLHV